MAATHARTHITHTLLRHTYGGKDPPSHAHKQVLLCISWWPVIELRLDQWYFRFGGLMHPSEEASALFFPCHRAVQGCRQHETWLERFTHTHTHKQKPLPTPCIHSFPVSLIHSASRHFCSSVTLLNNNTPSNAWLFTFPKELKSLT